MVPKGNERVQCERVCTQWGDDLSGWRKIRTVNSLRSINAWVKHTFAYSIVYWLGLMTSCLLKLADTQNCFSDSLHRLFQKSAPNRMKWISWWRPWLWGAPCRSRHIPSLNTPFLQNICAREASTGFPGLEINTLSQMWNVTHQN